MNSKIDCKNMTIVEQIETIKQWEKDARENGWLEKNKDKVQDINNLNLKIREEITKIYTDCCYKKDEAKIKKIMEEYVKSKDLICLGCGKPIKEKQKVELHAIIHTHLTEDSDELSKTLYYSIENQVLVHSKCHNNKIRIESYQMKDGEIISFDKQIIKKNIIPAKTYRFLMLNANEHYEEKNQTAY